MNTINILGFVFGILGLITTLLGLGYAVWSTRQFTKGIKFNALNQIRTLINRMDEDKQPENSIQRETMHHTQQDLEALFKGLQNTFNVPNKDAPL